MRAALVWLLIAAACTGTPRTAEGPARARPPTGPLRPTFEVTLVPQTGVTGVQRVNLAVPLPPGRIVDAQHIRVGLGSTRAELPAARRALASYPDGSPRSVQLQVDVDVDRETTLAIEVGLASAAPSPPMVPVSSTLVSDLDGPRVWALLPATWMPHTGVVGPLRAYAAFEATPLDAWRTVCDYAAFGTERFEAEKATTGSWLYDRPTALFRGHAMTGELGLLASAWREVVTYRAGAPIADGVATAIAVPGATTDLKYHYAQGLAIHYLLSGDDRSREAAEAVAARVRTLWTDPGYDGGTDFWTERHAGFALLAYEWAAMVSDDRAAVFAGYADQAVTAYLAVQARYPVGYDDPAARCFAHDAAAHDEPFGTVGCSPWMSAILAEGLDTHQRRVGGARRAAVQASLIQLGRIVARDGRDDGGRPLYWMGVGPQKDQPDDFDEHWGEAAYVVAMAWHHDGRRDPALRRVADELVAGLRSRGKVGQLRSFNWQCRSAVATPYFLE